MPASPAGRRSTDRPHGPGVHPHCSLLLPVPSLALQPPSLLGGSFARGWSALSLPPPNSCTRGGGSVAPSSPVAGCPSCLRGWSPPSGSPPTPGSPPWAAADGTPGAATRVSDTSPAPLLVSGLPRPASTGCSGAPGWLAVAETATALGPWSWSAAGSRWLSPSTSVTQGGGLASVPLLPLASAPVPLESPYLQPYSLLVLQA